MTFEGTYNLLHGIGGSWYLIHPDWKRNVHKPVSPSL
jgi:hypothetical protein